MIENDQDLEKAENGKSAKKLLKVYEDILKGIDYDSEFNVGKIDTHNKIFENYFNNGIDYNKDNYFMEKDYL